MPVCVRPIWKDKRRWQEHAASATYRVQGSYDLGWDTGSGLCCSNFLRFVYFHSLCFRKEFLGAIVADAVAVLLNPVKMSLAYFGHLLVFRQISTVFLLSSSSWARFIMFGPRRELEELCNVIIYARRASLRVFR